MLLYDLMACQNIRATLNHGEKEYAEAILNQLIKRDVNFAGIFDSRRLIDSKYLDYCRARGGLIDIREHSLQDCIDSKAYSAFYSATPESYPDIQWFGVRFIGTIHGLRYVEVPSDCCECEYTSDFLQFFKSKKLSWSWKNPWKQRKALEKVRKVITHPSFVCITPSEHTKYTLLYHFPTINSDSIHVFYSPLDVIDDRDVLDGGDSEYKKYYLFVSGNRWIKNTYRGIKAIDELISAGRFNSQVVITGVPHRLHYMSGIRNKDYFTFKGYVSSEELATLYKQAYCFVFLSLSEGFGYSPLEAIARGTPVICSSHTALPEIFQSGVMYCNPTSDVDIKVKILAMEDQGIHDQYKQRGLAQSKCIMQRQREDLPKLVDFILSYT